MKTKILPSRVIQAFMAEVSNHWFLVLCEDGSIWRYWITTKTFELETKGHTPDLTKDTPF